jgi:hypothetical protein
MKPINSVNLELEEITIEEPNPLEMAQRIAKGDYQDDEVDFLLEKHLAENTLPIPSRMSRLENQKDFQDFLNDYAASDDKNGFQQIAMSVELTNGRRAALITDGKQVMWSDPMGIDSIPDHIKESLQKTLNINPDQIIITRDKFQHSTVDDSGNIKESNNHSAAFSIYLLSALSKGELFLNPNDSKLFGINSSDNSLANLEEMRAKGSQKLGITLRNEHLADLKEHYPEEAEKISQFKAENPVKKQQTSSTIPSFGKILSNIIPLTIGFLAMLARPAIGQVANRPSKKPILAPTTFAPTSQPWKNTPSPSQTTEGLTFSPTRVIVSNNPTQASQNTLAPSKIGGLTFSPAQAEGSRGPTKSTINPTRNPSGPSSQPTGNPTGPSSQPTGNPTGPSSQPTQQPSFRPNGMPSRIPTGPSSQPTGNPTQPTQQPSSSELTTPTPPTATTSTTTLPNEVTTELASVGAIGVVEGISYSLGATGATGEFALAAFESAFSTSVFTAGSNLLLGGVLGGGVGAAVGAAVGAGIGAAIDYGQSGKGSDTPNNAEQNQNITSSNSTAIYSARKLSDQTELKTEADTGKSNTNQGAYLGGIAGATLGAGLFAAAILKRRARARGARVGESDAYSGIGFS